MAQQLLFLGTVPNDGTGTKARPGGQIINENFTELYEIPINTVSIAGAPIVLDLNSFKHRIFVGSANITSNKTFSISNPTNARQIFLFFQCNADVVLTFPSNFKMADVRWNSATQQFTALDTGLHKAVITFDGTNWYMDITAPYA